MKRSEQLTHLQKMNVADLRKEILELEKKIQQAKLSVAFGKSKEVSTIGNLRKQLARTLTIGNQKLSQNNEASDVQTSEVKDK